MIINIEIFDLLGSIIKTIEMKDRIGPQNHITRKDLRQNEDKVDEKNQQQISPMIL